MKCAKDGTQEGTQVTAHIFSIFPANFVHANSQSSKETVKSPKVMSENKTKKQLQI